MISEHYLSLSRQVTGATLSWRLRQARRSAPAFVPVADRMLYVPASCLPYHISGYTTRTQAVIRALRDAGTNVCAMTRPGYPWDRNDRCCDAAESRTLAGGVEYRHARRPFNNVPVLAYAFLAAKPIIRLAIRERVAAIHAASNHVNALPALLAARKLGIPFHYEMRGLWELTRISRMSEYERSQAFRQGLELEALVARNADRLFVISEQLGRYVRENWGVPAERMSLLPNCIDPGEVLAADPAMAEPNTIGYAGSLIVYEGLDTLLEATAMLVRQGKAVQVRIAGEGEARRDLEALSARLGLAPHVQFLGRMEPGAARDMIARCSLVCLPRKPFQVCEIVPPIKLVEALAMAKPVIVPDLPVFRDELGADPAGWFFRAGDAADLAGVIEGALRDPARLAGLGAKARQYVLAHRTWDRFVGRVFEPHGQSEATPCSV